MYTIEDIARFAHEINRAYCDSLRDFSQPEWSQAPQWQKDSAIAGVKAHLEHPGGLSPEISHQIWLDHKRNEGWSYGPVKDPAKKQHPCFRPYHDLPQEQRAKDYLFAAVIKLMRDHLHKQ